MSTNNNIRRRALLGGTRNTNAHESIVEYEYPNSIIQQLPYSIQQNFIGRFGPYCIVNVNWPEGITTIDNYTFYTSCIDNNCFNNIPDTVTIIGGSAFYACLNLSGEIILPKNLKICGDSAFKYSNNITSITLPETDCIFGPSALYISYLSNINLSENTLYSFQGEYGLLTTPWLSSKANGNVYLGKNYYQYKGTMPANTSVVLEEGTLSISASAFYGKSQLVSITIPDTVKFIGGKAFSGCTKLTEITIPKSLNKDLYELALESEYIRTSVGGGTSSKYFGELYSPFYSSACTGITTVNWNAIDGYGGNSPSSMYCFLGGGNYLPNVTTINFGPEVETIPSYLCYGLKKLTSITIPSSVKFIGYNAFNGCTGLTEITIPETITEIYISGNILSGCTGLTTLNYNAISVKKVDEYGGHVSNNNSNLWGTTSNLTTINIGSQVQVIPPGFLGSGQSKITSITIPNSVTTVEDYAFYQSKLTSIDLPNSVTSIGERSFYGCSSLTSITIRATIPPTLDSSYSTTFPTMSQNYKIYVPASAVDTYKTTTGWSYYSSKIQAIPS